MATLKIAIGNRAGAKAFVFHSDRGVQYACEEFRKELLTYPLIRQNMGCRPNCWDNAVPKSFFKTLKTECVYGHKFENQKSATRAIFEFSEIWYKRERLHSSLGYRTPAQMEELLNIQHIIA